MKARKQVVDAVELAINEEKDVFSELYVKNETIRIVLSMYGIIASDRQIRAAIQELRNSGRVRLLIATGKGYKFATTTAEVQTYIKRLHKKAMNDLRLIQNIKSQAEADLGMQVNMEFWNEIYKQTK